MGGNLNDMAPAEVHVIAKQWAGRDARVSLVSEGVWRFRSHDPEDGFIYEVRRPGEPFPVFEDSGRPAGFISRSEWTVRCLTDAPDAWWTVSPKGYYHPAYSEPYILEGWPSKD